MADNEDTIEMKGLDQLIKALKSADQPKCRIGILGSHSSRRGSSATNAEIGAAHEFGSPSRNLPQRSFLRVPISDNLNKKLEQSDMLSEDKIKEVVQAGSIKPWLETVAIIAEGIVAEAFDTSGGGKWAPWKDPNYTNEGGQLLVDTQQLRNSITSEVK